MESWAGPGHKATYVCHCQQRDGSVVARVISISLRLRNWNNGGIFVVLLTGQTVLLEQVQ